MKFVNLTPHPVTLRLQGTGVNFGDLIEYEIPSQGLARLTSEDKEVGEIPVPLEDDGDLWRRIPDKVGYIPITVRNFGEITGLPEPVEGVTFVASMVVAQAAAKLGRRDVLAPDTGPSAVRSEDGKVIAVQGLVLFSA